MVKTDPCPIMHGAMHGRIDSVVSFRPPPVPLDGPVATSNSGANNGPPGK